jgi:histidine triad (HIT) family protein
VYGPGIAEDPPCVFCAIVAGEHDAHLVDGTAEVVAFLDQRPLFPGHTLVVPRPHVETLPDLPTELVLPFFARVQLLAAAVQQAQDAHGTFVALNNRVSQSVPHLHVHVVPRRFKDGLRGFFWPRHRYESEDEAAEIAARIRKAVEALDRR